MRDACYLRQPRAGRGLGVFVVAEDCTAGNLANFLGGLGGCAYGAVVAYGVVVWGGDLAR